MARLYIQSGAAEATADLHQASAIVRDHRIGAALAHARYLVGEHPARDVRELDREHPAEAATFLHVAQLAQTDSADRAQQEARLVAPAPLAQQMGSRMICGGGLEARSQVAHFHHADQELRKFVYPR